MSLIPTLLDEFAGERLGWRADPRGTYVATVDQDVILNLRESPCGEALHIYSAAGDLRERFANDAPPLAANLRAWVHSATRLVVLVCTLRRGELDASRFASEVHAFVAAVREWRMRLQAEGACG